MKRCTPEQIVAKLRQAALAYPATTGLIFPHRTVGAPADGGRPVLFGFLDSKLACPPYPDAQDLGLRNPRPTRHGSLVPTGSLEAPRRERTEQ